MRTKKFRWLEGREYFLYRLHTVGFTPYLFKKTIFHCGILQNTGAMDEYATNPEYQYGAEPISPINVGFTYKSKFSKFIKLYDERPYDIEDFLPTNNMLKDKIKLTTKISYKRTRSTFVNKFTKHGRKASAQKAYAHVIAKYHAVYLNKRTSTTLMINNAIYKAARIYRYGIAIDNTLRTMYTWNFKRIIKGSKFGMYLNYKFDWESSEGAYNMMARWSPIKALVVNRVSKAVYKNTRGKSGRYQSLIKYIGPNHKFSFMQRCFKQTFKFSTIRKFKNKLYMTLYGLLIEPKMSLGFTSRRTHGDRIIK